MLCDIDGNFCSRGQCRNCGATAPARIRKLASKRKKQNKQDNGKSHAKCDALAKAQRQIADSKRRTTSQKSPSGPKDCPNGCGQTRAVSNPYHQQLAAALTALADEHRAAKPKEMLMARRVQQLDMKIEKKEAFGGFAGGLRTEICPNSCSIFKRCFRTQANKCKTPKRNWASYKQSVPTWLRRVRLQGSKTISSFCCAVPCLSLMRPLAHTWAWWSEWPLLVVPDPQRPARQIRCIKICRRLRRKTEKAAHSQPTKQAQSVTFDASLTSQLQNHHCKRHVMGKRATLSCKGRLKLQVRIIWMVLHLTQILLNCDVRDELIIGRFGCIAGDHTVPHAQHISLLRAAQHATRFWKDDGHLEKKSFQC